uniref:J domain-containing protein n=1 Tax=Oryza meridionalis TaxID=40149 RepID=A0A0E0CSI4_9ORYZ
MGIPGVRSLLVASIVLSSIALHVAAAKSLDPYKVLGVDKSASQRDIQKAFHKSYFTPYKIFLISHLRRLSLKYHPDKNKSKGAQEKFAEINNAYDILSDEEKRKNYDLYGDEKGNPGFDGGNFGNREGYTYFTGGGAKTSHFSSGDGWQTMGGQGNTKTFSFSFGGGNPGAGGGNPFNFDFGDVFSNIFSGGSMGGSQHTGSAGKASRGTKSSGHDSSSVNIQEVTMQIFNKETADQGITWLLLFYTPNTKGQFVLESVVEDVARSLDGALRAGKVNCDHEKALCKKAGVSIGKSARLFIYSYTTTEKGSLHEYSGDYDSKSLKTFCQEHLPRFSKRVDINQFSFPSNIIPNLPQVLLLSAKKDTPAMWRAVSGMFRSRLVFYDAEVQDVSHPLLKSLGVKNIPALIGRSVNGEEQLLKDGISVKDLRSGIKELKNLLENFEKKNKKLASNQAKKPAHTDQPKENKIPLLTASNFEEICGEKTSVCILGIFKSSKAKENLEAILSEISQKTLIRGQNYNSGNAVAYALLDGNKQSAFLSTFDKSAFKSSDKLLLAYKPRRGRYAVYDNEVTMEEAERLLIHTFGPAQRVVGSKRSSPGPDLRMASRSLSPLSSASKLCSRCGQADEPKMAATTFSSSPSKVTTAKLGGGVTRSSSPYTQLTFCSRHQHHFQKAATTAAAFHKPPPAELSLLLSPARSKHARTCPAADNDRAAPAAAAAQEATNTPTPTPPPPPPAAPSANGSPPQEPPKRAPLTARERLRAARVLGKYAEPGGASPKGKAAAAAAGKKPEFGSRVLDALRETDGKAGKKRSSRLPEAPSNMFDDSKRGLPKEGWTFEALPFGTDVIVIAASFTLITVVMFGTTYLVWKLGAIHFNEF